MMIRRPSPALSIFTLVLASLCSLPAIANSDTIVVRQFENLGMERCLEQWKEINRFLAESTRAVGAHSIWHKEQPDERMANAVMELDYPDGSSVSVSAVSPTIGGGCDYTMVRVAPSPKHCVSLANEMADDRVRTFTRRVLHAERGGSNRYFLPSPDGDQCIQIIVETVYMPAGD